MASVFSWQLKQVSGNQGMNNNSDSQNTKRIRLFLQLKVINSHFIAISNM